MDEALSVSETLMPRSTVIRRDGQGPVVVDDPAASEAFDGLVARYRAILDQPRLDWTERHTA